MERFGKTAVIPLLMEVELDPGGHRGRAGTVRMLAPSDLVSAASTTPIAVARDHLFPS